MADHERLIEWQRYAVTRWNEHMDVYSRIKYEDAKSGAEYDHMREFTNACMGL